MVVGNTSYAFIKHLQQQSRTPLEAHAGGRESQTAALLGGTFEDCVDILSAKPLAMYDCFYLFDTKKYKIDSHGRDGVGGGRKVLSAQRLAGFHYV